MTTKRLAFLSVEVKSASTSSPGGNAMDTVLEDLIKTREPLMQYRRFKRLLQFVRDTSAARSADEAEAVATTTAPETEPRRTSRI